MPTWNGSTDGSFTNDDNWDTVAAVDGDTIIISADYDAMSNPLPTSNQPTSGTYHFYISGESLNHGGIWYITNELGPGFFIDDGAAIGDVVIDGYDALTFCGAR
jgi:hypothetical protein